LIFGGWIITKYGQNDEWGIPAIVLGIASILYALYSLFAPKLEE
jgi:hypothetical protein